MEFKPSRRNIFREAKLFLDDFMRISNSYQNNYNGGDYYIIDPETDEVIEFEPYDDDSFIIKSPEHFTRGEISPVWSTLCEIERRHYLIFKEYTIMLTVKRDLNAAQWAEYMGH